LDNPDGLRYNSRVLLGKGVGLQIIEIVHVRITQVGIESYAKKGNLTNKTNKLLIRYLINESF